MNFWEARQAALEGKKVKRLSNGYTYKPEIFLTATWEEPHFKGEWEIVEEYVEQVSTEEPTSKQQDTLPAEPVPGKFYRTKNDDKVLYVGKAQNMWVYDFIESGYNMTLSKYHKPFMHYNVEHSKDDIVSEWKEAITLPPVEIVRWARVQAVDTRYTKRGEILGVSEYKDLLEEQLEEDEELVKLVGILPKKEVEG